MGSRQSRRLFAFWRSNRISISFFAKEPSLKKINRQSISMEIFRLYVFRTFPKFISCSEIWVVLISAFKCLSMSILCVESRVLVNERRMYLVRASKICTVTLTISLLLSNSVILRGLQFFYSFNFFPMLFRAPKFRPCSDN